MLDNAPGPDSVARAEAAAASAPASPAPSAPEAEPTGDLDQVFAPPPEATGLGAGVGPPGSAPPAYSPPAAPPQWETQLQQVYHVGGQLVQAYQTLQSEEAAAQNLLARAGGQLPYETLQALQAEQAERAKAYAQIERAATKLEGARDRALLAQREAQFRTAYEPAAETLTITELVSAAQRADRSVDGKKMREYLKGFGADTIIPAAQKYFALHRDGVLGTRAANGTDRMGGPGGAAANNWGNLSEGQLYEIGIEQSDRRRGQRR